MPIYEELTTDNAPQTTEAGNVLVRAEAAASSTAVLEMERNMAYQTCSATIPTSYNEAYGKIHHR